MDKPGLNIGVIGAGLTGLVAAWELSKQGHRVTVIDREKEPGGLAGTFPFRGTRLEKFYHHIFKSDLETIRLIQELGLGSELLWRQTPMGIFKNQQILKFSTPMDLLKFTPLSFFNRIRVGVVILYLALVKNWRRYENTKAEAWIRRGFGEQAWQVIWGPLLHGKFGEFANLIGMPWFYSRIHTRAGSRDKSMTKESLGYLKGSFQVLHNTLMQAIRNQGGTLRLGETVKQLEIKQGAIVGWKTAKGREAFDAVLVTLAPPALLPLLPPGLSGEYWQKLQQIDYLGNVCTILTVKRSYSPIYWMNVPDVASPFIAVIEHTNFIPKENYLGSHVIYLSSYVSTRHPRYLASERELLQENYAYLKKVLPAFDPSDVQAAQVFHAPYAQPVIRAGFSQCLVPIVSPVAGLFLANMAQIYPEDRGMSYCIRLGQQAAATLATQAVVRSSSEVTHQALMVKAVRKRKSVRSSTPVKRKRL